MGVRTTATHPSEQTLRTQGRFVGQVNPDADIQSVADLDYADGEVYEYDGHYWAIGQGNARSIFAKGGLWTRPGADIVQCDDLGLYLDAYPPSD